MGGLNKYGPSRQTTFFLSYFPDPADTRCNNSAIMTSKRRRDVVLTSQWRYCCVMCPLGMTQVFQIWFHLNLFLDIHLTNSYMSLRKGLGNGLVPKCYTHPIINALPKPVVMIIFFCLLGLPYQRHFDVKKDVTSQCDLSVGSPLIFSFQHILHSSGVYFHQSAMTSVPGRY